MHNSEIYSMSKIYPHKTPEQLKYCAEMQRKADQAAVNIKYAVNKRLAIESFFTYLLLAI